MFGKYININTHKFFSKIWNILKICKVVVEKHKFLTLANFIVIFLGLLACIYCLIYFEPENKVNSFLYLCPILAVYIVSLLAYFIFKKFSTLSRIFSALLNTTIILLQIFVTIVTFAFCPYDEEIDYTEYNKVANYRQTILLYNHKRVAHFPAKIPKEATNIVIDARPVDYFGSQRIYLKFDINKEYINNELKKYSYIKILDYHKASEQYGYFASNIDFSKYIYFVINDKAHEKLEKQDFPYHYGIATNREQNQILYYYDYPDIPDLQLKY